jgi:hypothetical protein
MGIEKSHRKLMIRLGDDAYGLFQIKIWLLGFKTGNLSCSDLPRVRRPPVILGPQVEAFLHKCPFESVRIIVKRSLTPASNVKEILQTELGMRKFSRRWVPHSLSDAEQVARSEAAK